MKNTKLFKSIFTLLLTLSFGVALFGCVEVVSYNVTFESEGTIVTVAKVESGKTVSTDQLPVNPTKEGYHFVGWFNGDVEFKQDVVVDKDVTYTAKFEKIPTYNVSFSVDGKEIVKFEVLEGMLVSEFPADPTKEGYNFVGWYNGDVEFNKDAAVYADVTYTAKFSEKVYYTISFVVEEEEILKVKVEEGKTIDFAVVPMDPTKKAYEFMGWFNGDEQFDELAKVEKDVTYTAKYERTHYIVTFGETELLVPVEGLLSMKEVENPSQEGAYFAGWYAEGVKAVDGLQLEKDTTFTPLFVTLDSFNGTWASSKGLWFMIENGKVVSGKFGEKGMTFTFDVTTGTLSYKESSYVFNQHSFEVTKTGIKYLHSYWDGVYEEMVNEEVELAKPMGNELVGTYTSEKTTYITIIEGGVVTRYNGVLTTTGMLVKTEDGYTIQYATSSSNEKTMNLTFDEKGNMIAEGKIYVKNADNFAYLYCSNAPTFYFYTVNGEQVVTVKDGATSYYGTLEGTIKVNEIITVRYNEKEVLVKVTSDTAYVLPGNEKGSYKQGENTLVLDGFGNATINGEQAEYELNGAGVALVGENGYKLNSTDNTYVTLTKDTVNTGKYVENGNAKYFIEFDGFGGVAQTYAGSYSTTVNKGSYTLTKNGVKIANVSYSYNGEWTFELDGKALVKGDTVYLLEGAVFEDVREALNGSYGENGEYVVTTGKIIVNGTEYNLTYNFNGSKATYQVKHKDPNSYGNEVEFTDTITLSKTADGKLKVLTEHVTWDEYEEYPESTFSEAEYPVYIGTVEPTYDGYEGTWKQQSGNKNTIVFDGQGKGTFNGTAFTYTVNGSNVTFTVGAMYLTVTGTAASGTLHVVWEDDDYNGGSYDIVKEKEVAPMTDGYEGTWKQQSGNKNTIVFDGQGKGTFNGTAFTYTVNGSNVTFTVGAMYFTVTGNVESGTLHVAWEDDDYNGSSYDIVRQ